MLVVRPVPRVQRLIVLARSSQSRLLSTEHVTSTHPIPPPPPSPSSSTHPSPASKPRPSRLYPRPRPAVSHQHQALPTLPATFGRNQLLPVSDSTRALLEDIVASFDAPIRYAVAYGSGVFGQEGYAEKKDMGAQAPMLDFIFAVTHPDHWHSINLHQHPSHYPLHARALGSSFVSKFQEITPGVWFNTFVPMHGVNIKYGVTTVDTLCSDLLNWRSLYLAGRLHKPLRIIKDDARVRLTQQVNLTSAVRAALLTLPETFTPSSLFSRVASISYSGDPRMFLPAENRGKVDNIVRRQEAQFTELYQRLVVGLPGVRWEGNVIEQDLSSQARVKHLRKLPEELLSRVRRNYDQRMDGAVKRGADEGVWWLNVAGDPSLSKVLNEEMANIVRYPATVQTLKGLVSAGLGKSMRYTTQKIGKWWSGSSSKTS